MFFIAIMLSIIPVKTGSSAPLGTKEMDPKMVIHLMNSIDKILNRYQGYSFNRVLSLGNPTIFRDTLSSSKYKITMSTLKKKKAQARAVEPNTLELMYDPIDVPPYLEEEFNITVWHETIHLIEYKNGDSFGDTNWNERHAEYFEYLVKNVLDKLKDIEDRANNPKIPDDSLIQQWRLIVRTLKAGIPYNKSYPHPPDPAMFERWSGVKIKFSDIEKHYTSGAGGSRMKKIIESTFITGISINQIRVKVLPRNISDNETRFKVTCSFTILAEPGHMNWRGTVGRFLRIQLPKSKSKKPKIIKDASGSLPNCSPGLNDADFLFSLPDKTPENTYDMMLRLNVHGHADIKKKKITLKYPPVKFNVSGPKEVEDGDICEAKVKITSGVPPFKWEWSGGGASGKGSATAFDMVVNKAPTPSITYNVKVWDKIRSASPQKGPVVQTFTVKVKKKRPDLKIGIKYPKESAVGRVIDIITTVTEGTGKYRYEWINLSGNVVAKKDLKGMLRIPGNKTLKLSVWDDGRYKTTPKITFITIKAYPKLEGRILAPKEALSGDQVTIKAELKGGKKPYKYLWTNPVGRNLNKESLKGTVRGKPGEEKRIKLRVEDSLTPPQVLNLEAAIKLSSPLVFPGSPYYLLGNVLKLTELGFHGTFKRRGSSSTWIGSWAGGCQKSKFTLRIGKIPSTNAAVKVRNMKVAFLRQDGNKTTCPFSPGFTAVYNGTVTLNGGLVTIKGKRTVKNPGTSVAVKNAVKDNNIKVAPFTGSIHFDPGLVK